MMLKPRLEPRSKSMKTAKVQTRPGGPIEEASMKVFEVPVDPLWAENSQGELLPGVLAYESGWLAFHPNSSVYSFSTAAPGN